jgi:hypothetical protein
MMALHLQKFALFFVLAACSPEPGSKRQVMTNIDGGTAPNSQPPTQQKPDDQQIKSLVPSELKQTNDPVRSLAILKNFNNSVINCYKQQSEAACNNTLSLIDQATAELKDVCATDEKYACSVSVYPGTARTGIQDFKKKCVIMEPDPTIPENKRQQLDELTKSYCTSMAEAAPK